MVTDSFSFISAGPIRRAPGSSSRALPASTTHLFDMAIWIPPSIRHCSPLIQAGKVLGTYAEASHITDSIFNPDGEKPPYMLHLLFVHASCHIGASNQNATKNTSTREISCLDL